MLLRSGGGRAEYARHAYKARLFLGGSCAPGVRDKAAEKRADPREVPP